MKQNMRYLTLITLTILVMITGCRFFSSGTSEGTSGSSSADTQGEPFIRFKDKTVLSFEGFRNRIKMLQETQPGVEALLNSMPEADQLRVYSQIADGCIAEKLVIEYVNEKGLSKTAKFKEYAQQAHEALDTRLYMQAFEEEMRREVDEVVNKMTNAEIRSFYETNREKHQMFQREPFMKRRAKDEKGVAAAKAEYAPFDTVAEMVKEVLKQEKLQELVLAKFEDLKKHHGAQIETQCLQRLVVKKDPSKEVTAPALVADEEVVEEESVPVSNGAVPGKIPGTKSA